MRELPPLRGQIWNVFTPGQPAGPDQPRPVLIVSNDVRNRHEDDVLVVPVFSHGPPGPTHIAIKRGTGGLDHDSLLFCEEITTLDAGFLEEGPLGTPVPDGLLRQVTRGVRIAMGEVVLPGE